MKVWHCITDADESVIIADCCKEQHLNEANSGRMDIDRFWAFKAYNCIGMCPCNLVLDFGAECMAQECLDN